MFPVSRTVPYTQAVGKAAIQELLEDVSPAEHAEGYGSSIPLGVKVNSLKNESGIAYVDLNSKLDENIGGSCMVTTIRTQITKTLKQFPTVNEVVISVEGSVEEVLQP